MLRFSIPWATMCVLKLRRGTEPLRFSVHGLVSCTFLLPEEYLMPDFEYLYHTMVHAAEDAIDAMEGGNVWDAKRILIDAERRAEARYIDESATDEEFDYPAQLVVVK